MYSDDPAPSASASPATSRGAPTPDKLHDRAAESARETRQSVLTLSSGALAVFFVVLTSQKEITPALTGGQKGIILGSLSCMALCVICSLWCAFADAQWSYCWARELENRGDEDCMEHRRKKNLYHSQKRVSDGLSRWFFGIGVVLAAIYLFSRVNMGTCGG